MNDRIKPTATLLNKVGKLSIRRGKAVPGEEVKIWSFDAIGECTFEECPAFIDCSYKSRGDKCGVQLSYIRSIWGMIYDNYSERFTEPFLFRIGTHMIPLYKGLCKMKIQEIGVENVCYTTDKGSIMIHPIYKEIRAQLTTIGKEWSSLGMAEGLLPEIDFGGMRNAN